MQCGNFTGVVRVVGKVFAGLPIIAPYAQWVRKALSVISGPELVGILI
jgi:hypothetical protein